MSHPLGHLQKKDYAIYSFSSLFFSITTPLVPKVQDLLPLLFLIQLHTLCNCCVASETEIRRRSRGTDQNCCYSCYRNCHGVRIWTNEPPHTTLLLDRDLKKEWHQIPNPTCGLAFGTRTPRWIWGGQAWGRACAFALLNIKNINRTISLELFGTLNPNHILVTFFFTQKEKIAHFLLDPLCHLHHIGQEEVTRLPMPCATCSLSIFINCSIWIFSLTTHEK